MYIGLGMSVYVRAILSYTSRLRNSVRIKRGWVFFSFSFFFRIKGKTIEFRLLLSLPFDSDPHIL